MSDDGLPGLIFVTELTVKRRTLQFWKRYGKSFVADNAKAEYCGAK